MEYYKQYQIEKGFSKSSIATHARVINRFENWLKKEQLTVNQIGYNDITTYINHLKQKGNAQRTIQLELGALKHYFNYLTKQGEVRQNPIQHIKIQGIQRQQLYDILNIEELDYLYHSLHEEPLAKAGKKSSEAIKKRNKVIVGLLVYQGLNTTNLANLKLEHIQLDKGRIEIVETKKSNSRFLKLEPCQILELQHFILVEREQLLIAANKETEALIFSNGTGNKIHNLLNKLLKEIKEFIPKAESINQIRASVITHWLKQQNLREVQYRAGHRFVSSTEAYRINDIESLQHDITKYSPSL